MSDQEKRKKAIRDIEMLFPPDAPYPATAEIGESLLKQAKREVAGWRSEPTEVLVRMAHLCREKERAQANNHRHPYHL